MLSTPGDAKRNRHLQIIRPIVEDDLDALCALAEETGTGMTSMPKDRASHERRIAYAREAFTTADTARRSLGYLFVLEDVDSGKVVGTTGIKTGIGYAKPFYSYRLLKITQVSLEPQSRVDTELLQLSNDFTGAAEVGSLFLLPDFRKAYGGRMLAKMRYLFMGAFPERFPDQVIAEIRGWVDDDDKSPFWDAIGRHFFDMEFAEADEINGRGNSQFIADLMPKFPIYTALLPKAAQAVIGKPNDGAVPAVKLLEAEGFRFSGAVDIFDGGPTFNVARPAIRTIRSSRLRPLAGTVDGESAAAKYLIAKDDLDDFRVTMGQVAETDSGVWIAESVARALDLTKGDLIRYAPLNPV